MLLIRSDNKLQVPTISVYIFILLGYLDESGSTISVSPSEGPFTKIKCQSLGPIICSAQCDPPCHVHWIKSDGIVVDGSNLAISRLSSSDHGTCTCHTGNGYGNNATTNIFLTVNCKY
jgi:hypothetical protein